jgi:very-short-patch-repair endonuclease
LSKWEDALAFQIMAAQLPVPERQYVFAPPRRWRFDFAWPRSKVGLEVDGGIWIQGRHARGAGILKDCEKLSTAAALGWRVLRVAPEHVKKGLALMWLTAALELKSW